MAFLSEKIADTICTAIVFGFTQEQIKKNGSMVFQYETDGDRDTYEKVLEAFDRSGITSVFMNLSQAQGAMPYIVGSGNGQKWLQNPDMLEIMDSAVIEYVDTIANMMAEADKTGQAPYGAYIGGVFTFNDGTIKDRQGTQPEIEKGVNDMRLVGPSSLTLYTPVYRDPNHSGFAFCEPGEIKGETIQKNYCEKRESIDKAICAIDLVVGGNENSDEKEIILAEGFHKDNTTFKYEPGKLYRSCHGMIRAMIKYPTESNQYYFEIALGSRTTKVSSCVPCAIFMESMEMPASSIHLGRGDSWGIPNDNKDIWDPWAKNIYKYFNTGVEALSDFLFLKVDDIGDKSFYDFINQDLCKVKNNLEKEIPYIFLESLTFEKSFSNRILDTFEAMGSKI
jgi:hypothetical protein